jgi:hypothetical protein
MKHTDSVKFKKGKAVVLLQGTNAKGKDVFCYLHITKKNYQKLLDDIETIERIDFKEYGDTLLEGIGRPNRRHREYMQEEYGFEHPEEAA